MAERDVPALVQRAILGVLSHIPSTREPHGTSPVTRARAIAKVAARKTATVSGSLSLPPGPAGWLTIIPDLTLVWKIQSQMVADIAGAFGKESVLSRQQMVYCLFRHMAAHTVRRAAFRGVSRWLPVIGAAGVAGYAYYDTMRVADTTIELFRSELAEVEDVVEESVSG